MAPNFPGPLEIRLNYSCLLAGATRFHQSRMSVVPTTEGNPGDPFSAWTLQQRGGGTVALDVWATTILVLMEPNYANTATFIDFELWKYAAGTNDAAFQSTFPAGTVGTAGGGNIVDGQAIITFRAQLGGSARWDMRETIHAAGPTVPIATSPAPVLALATAFTDPTSCMYARDNSYVFTALNFLPGLNERAFKRRQR